MTMLQEEAELRQNVKPTYGYYRQPNGWITVSPATELEELHYRKEGWQPLFQYGLMEMNSGWVADHPLEQLLVMGGAHELCEQQLRQQGLLIKPPVMPTCGKLLNQYHKHHGPSCWVGAKPVVFPQAAGLVDIGPFPCHFCQVEKPTTEAREQHESVMHKDETSDIRTANALADALTEGLKPEQTAVPQTTEFLLAELHKLRSELETLKRGNSIVSPLRRRAPRKPRLAASTS